MALQDMTMIGGLMGKCVTNKNSNGGKQEDSHSWYVSTPALLDIALYYYIYIILFWPMGLFI
jgi:hypothetical protein